MIRVRLAGPDDAPAIVSIALEVQELHVAGRPDIFKPGGSDTAAEIVARIESDTQFYWVAVDDGAIIGYAFGRVVDEPENRWKYASRILQLDQMAVARRARRLGAGRDLWEAVRERAVTLGVDRIVLNVWAFNVPARRFYERMGLTPFHERMALELSRDSRDQR